MSEIVGTPAKYLWALDEEVCVTLIRTDAENIESDILVERIARPGAVVVSFRDTEVLLNGIRLDVGDDLPQWCGLADALLMSPAPEPGDSVTLRCE